MRSGFPKWRSPRSAARWVVLALAALLTLAEPPRAVAEAPDTTAHGSRRSGALAVALSVVGTALPLHYADRAAQRDDERTMAWLACSGIVLGPAVGYFYGDCAPRGWTGAGVRALAIAAGVGLGVATQPKYSDVPTGLAYVVLGLTVASLEGAVDIVALPSYVQRRNREVAGTPRLAPVLLAGADGRPVPGVALCATW
jgi:hypothetical protein